MLSLALAGPALAAPSARAPIAVSAPVATAIRDAAGGDLRDIYAARGYRPFWIDGDAIGSQADTLIGYLNTAERDGLKRQRTGKLADAIDAARRGDPKSLGRAEIALTKAFVRLVRDQRKPGGSDTIYADRALRPDRLSEAQVMRLAAVPASFSDYVDDMGWMSRRYVALRQLIGRAELQGVSEATLDRLHRNLDRARELPSPWTRHVVVDASAGRLWYYEAGRQIGTMRVVVGAQKTQTPLLAGMLQWAILNPYWNIPTYLARDSIAPRVLAGRSLAAQRIEALSDWSADARRIPAASVDWRAVAAGTQEIRLRELPGAHNSMGRVKFTFPNDEGIYLHDTNEPQLLRRADRHLSNGCIRLENAAALGKWLMDAPLPRAKKGAVEQAVPLPAGVPVFLTYLTPIEEAKTIAFRDDVYGRDG